MVAAGDSGALSGAAARGRRRPGGDRGAVAAARALSLLRAAVVLPSAVLPLAFGVSASCARRPPPPPREPLAAAEIVRLLAGTAAESAGIRRYQALFSVRGDSTRRGNERTGFSGRLLVLFERPAPADPPGAGDPSAVAALRISAYAPVGGARWSLVARPDRVRAVAPAARVFAEGTDLRAFTEPLFGLPVGLREVGAIVSGAGLPLPAAPEGAGRDAEPTPDGGARLPAGGRLWWAERPGDADGERPAARVVRAAGEGYEVRYPEAAAGGARHPPRTIEVRGDRVGARLTVEELEVNARLHPDSFRLPTGEGFRRRSVPEFLDAVRRRSR